MTQIQTGSSPGKVSKNFEGKLCMSVVLPQIKQAEGSIEFKLTPVWVVLLELLGIQQKKKKSQLGIKGG